MGGVANLPQNQINALPLQTIAQAIGGDEYTVVGGLVARYWSPTDLGLNAAAMPTVGPTYSLVTPYLDLRGMRILSVLMRRVAGPAASVALPNMQTWLQVRQGVNDTPPALRLVGGTWSPTWCGAVQIGTGTTFQAAAAGVEHAALITWGGVLQANYPGDIAAGFDGRLIFTWITNPPDVNNVVTVSIWGQG